MSCCQFCQVRCTTLVQVKDDKVVNVYGNPGNTWTKGGMCPKGQSLVELANSLPSSYKLRGLEEKLVLKRVAADLVPRPVLERPKQPYRAPDAQVFVGAGAPSWVADLLNGSAIADAGIFDPLAVQSLWRKCKSQADGLPFSNADNMALVGTISTSLIHESLVRSAPPRITHLPLTTFIDRVG
jgi:asparagine synthase (glutamine-hydrolysing)